MKIFILFFLIFSSVIGERDSVLYSEDTTDPSSPNTTTSITTSDTSSTTAITTQSTTTTTSVSTSTSVTTTPIPTSAPSGPVTINVTWIFISEIKTTNVTMIVRNLKIGQYAAIGLGQNQAMGEAHVFMCKRLNNGSVALNRYINPSDHDSPKSAGSEQGGTLEYGEQLYVDGVATCQFSLSNFNTITYKQLGTLRPLSQSGNYYPLFAIGPLKDTNQPSHHQKSVAQSNTVQLNKKETILYGITTTTTSNTPTTTTSGNGTESTTTILTTTSIVSTTTSTRSPTADVGVNVTWIFVNEVNVTNMTMTIQNLKQAQYVAIGLGQDKAMGEAHVFICKRLNNGSVALNRYINPNGHNDPEPAGSEQGGILKYGQQVYENGVVTCQFSLSNFNTITYKQLGTLRPLSQSGNYYPLLALGLLDDDSEPTYHGPNSRTFFNNTAQLNQKTTILYRVTNPSNDPSKKYFQTHGIIMVIVWIFLASTAALVARYFKNSWANYLICGKAAWYAIHRFLMSISVVLTVIAFLFVLVALQGKWVGSDEEIKHYVHSITGVIVISFAFFQPFLALFRCDPDSSYRFIFNYIHAFIGFSALILSIVTLFLATSFGFFKGDDRARIIMIIWSIWIVFIFIAFEFVQRYFKMKNANSSYTIINLSNKTTGELNDNPTSSTNQDTPEQKIKNLLLATHILAAAILSIFFCVLII